MKIRIKGNTLRYRLTKSEVTKLGTDGRLEERAEFAGKTLVYAIEPASEGATNLSADFINDKIVLYMPEEMVNELVNTERVGFEGSSGLVSLLIEKDFVCIDRVEEDQSDNYPNPSISCQ
jgi:hypothetical protein